VNLRSLLLPAIVSLWAVPVLHSQQGGEISGVSPIEAGTAGAAISTGRSLLDASTNPATLMDLFGPDSRHPRASRRFELVGRAVKFDSKLVSSSGSEIMLDQPTGFGPWLGYAARLGEDAVWSLAFQPTLSAEFSASRLTELQIVTVNPDGSGGPQTATVPMETELLQLALEPSVAWRASPAWSFGMGLSVRNTDFKSSSATEVALTDLEGPLPDSLSGIFGDLSWGELIQDLATDRGVDSFQATYAADASNDRPNVFLKFGGTWQADDNTRVGFWYRPQSSASNIEGQVDVDLSDDLGAFISELEEALSIELLDDPTSSYDFRLGSVAFPQQAGISMERALPHGQRIHAKAVWTDWSRAFSDWVVQLSNPSNPEFTEYLGGDGSIEIDLGIRWRDSMILAAGYEADVHPRLTLRGGLGWSRNPVAGSVLPGVSPFNQMHVAAGASLWGGPEGIADWHAAVVVAVPEKWTTGDNTVLEDLSGDRYDQSIWSAMLACTITW
jgi:long-subunit fatty acid transport protein